MKIFTSISHISSTLRLLFALLFLYKIIFSCHGQEAMRFMNKQHDVLFGVRLESGLLTRVTGQSLQSCVRECITRTRCRSLNYLEKMKLCELNYKRKSYDGVVLANLTGTVHINIDEQRRVSLHSPAKCIVIIPFSCRVRGFKK